MVAKRPTAERKHFAGLAALSLAVFISLTAQTAEAIEKCRSHSHETCVVDGDTIRLRGERMRLMSFDTPEPQTNICGGAAEVALAHRASDRLVELLNDGMAKEAVSITAHGTDRYGRTLVVVTVDGVDVGDILIAEGLARRWSDGDEFWCR